MTLRKPYLFLKRLVVISSDGKTAFDERFHRGVNIIRGQNSSGKSTIANFIFYALGGEYTNWTNAARNCRDVFAEVDINEASLTLKRNITDKRGQPMSIFWGSYEQATMSNFEGWQHFGYSQTANKESFSNALFRALEFPEVRDEGDNKITMNQILRLLYIDQESPSQSLFRFERFDQPLTRQAISEVLLGVYDDSLYSDRLNLREGEKKYNQKKEEFENVNKILGTSGRSVDIAKVTGDINKAKQELLEVEDEIIKTRERVSVVLRHNSPLKVELLQDEISGIKKKLISVSSDVKQLELDIVDSERFIELLRGRTSALDDSIETRNILGELPLDYCPQCLGPLGEHLNKKSCALCKQPLEENLEKTYAKRLKQEIDLQIKESGKLLEQKKERLAISLGERTPLVERFRILQREIDLQEKEVKTTRDERLDELLIKKGNLESKVGFLNEQIKAIEMLEMLRTELQNLQKEIERLKQNIRIKSENQAANLRNAHLRIEQIALSLLEKDLDRQHEFKNAQSVEVDFAKDVFTLDGSNNFSASSNVYFKNCVLYAIFFSSLELLFFRYPRFILCDNMEDKGMEQERTQNFQRVIVNTSSSHSVEHQIIFTTSMIAPDLNHAPLCVGREYTESNKSLEI